MNQCYKCEGTNESPLEHMFGYSICQTCKSKMGLFHDKTIQKYVVSHDKAREIDPAHPSFEEEIKRRLKVLEQDYISKRIKLLYVKHRLKTMK